MRHVGAHVSVAGGLSRALDHADARGCDAVQIFPSNPRGWAVPDVDTNEEEALRAGLEQRGWPLYLHAPYLVNLASPDDLVRARSVENLTFSIHRARRLGARGVIVHAGHARGADRRDALERLASSTRPLLDLTDTVDLVFEPTAGGSGAIAARTEDMAELLDVLDDHLAVAFCLDTCHLWAAGVDYSDPRQLRVLRRQVRELGPERFTVVHLNDSKDPCGSKRDRHENLGSGKIGLDAIRDLVMCPELRHAPLVVETPGGVDAQRGDVDLAQSWNL